MDVLHQVSYRLDRVPEELRDKEVCQAAYNHNFFNFRFIPHEILRQNLFFCVVAVRSHGDFLQYIPDDIIQLKSYLCTIAVKNSALALEFVPPNLKTYSICLSALKKNLNAISFVPQEYFDPDYDNNKFMKLLSRGKLDMDDLDDNDRTHYSRIFEKLKSMRSFRSTSNNNTIPLNRDVMSHIEKFGGVKRKRTRRV